jgi:hypothetical protein
MYKPLIVCLVALAPCLALAQQGPANTARVAVLASGKMLLNGKPSERVAIEAEFRKLKASKGAVWYFSQEGADGEPTPQAMEVMDLVGKYGLPVSLSSRPDFSDTVDIAGRSSPRKP